MDLATVIGFAMGFGAIIYGIIGSGVPFSAFIDPPSLLIVLGGTIAALFINFPMARVLGTMKILPLTFQAKEFDPVPIVTQLVEMADAGAKRGAAALEQLAQDLPDPFMRQGMELVASNAPDEQIRYVLETELAFMEERHTEGEGVISGFADYAPAFGLIGTLIGLVAMLAGLGGGGGGGAPRRTSMTHLPRSTGEVRPAWEVMVSTLACPRMPLRRSSVYWTLRRCDPVTPSTP